MSIYFNLREEILKEHSKTQRDKIVQWIGTDQKRFNQLLRLFLNDEYRVTQRASWALSYCAAAYPSFLKNKLGLLIDNLQKPGLHDAVKRNTVRILQDIDIPEKYQGKVMDICFNYTQSPTEAVAIKAFSLTILGNLAKLYPEILAEIKLVIEEQLPHETTAFKSRAKRLLKEAGIS